MVPVHFDGATEATFSISPLGEKDYLVEIRPKGKHHSYTISLSAAAEILAWRIAKLAQQKK